MAKRGAKDKYEEMVKPHLEMINKKIREGVTEAEIAKALGISTASFSNYKREHQELRDALKLNKGKDVLANLVNAGIESACGYYKTNTTTTYATNEDGQVYVKSKVETKTWYPPNATLNRFYVLNLGKDEGFVDSPMEFDLKKAKQDFEMQESKIKNWFLQDEGEK